MPKRTVIAHIWRGFWYLPHVGSHPGWPLALLLNAVAIGIGAQSGTWLDVAIAFGAMFSLSMVLMMIGARGRSVFSDHLEYKQVFDQNTGHERA